MPRPSAQNTHSTAPPLLITPARLLGKVKVLDIERVDLVRACRGLIQQPPQGRSRSDTSLRRYNAASWSRVNARVRSMGMLGRFTAAVGSVLSQACLRQKAQAERRIANSRTRVAEAVWS